MKVVLFVCGFSKYDSVESSILYVDSGVKKINRFIGNLIRKFNRGVLVVEVRNKIFVVVEVRNKIFEFVELAAYIYSTSGYYILSITTFSSNF